MSEWKGKEQLLDVSFNIDAHFLCVEHPGFVQNAEKALDTLGGLKHLAKVYEEPLKRLPLRFRVDDAYSKATYGDRFNVSNLLMKVIRRRRKSDGREDYKVVVLGRIETTYKFQSLLDFQYLPMKTNDDGNYESIYDKVRINRLVPLKEYLSQDVPLYLPPLTFSRADKPVDFHYKQEMAHRQGYKNPEKTRPPNLIGTMRQRRSVFTIFVNFGERLPTEPIADAVKRVKGEFVDHKAEQVLKNLFEEKPLFLKAEIEHRTGYKQQLKVFLPALCFYWLDGPWRGQWNKFGFDPTKNPSAKFYQTVDFRIRQLQPGQLDIKAKRGTNRLFQWNQLARSQKHNVKISLKSLQDDYIEDIEEEQIEKELSYKFKKDKLPPNRMMYYPVCYIELSEVQKLLHKNDGKETVCTEKDGWCVEDFNIHCRDIMYQYLNRLLSGDDTIESKFWRTKKKKRVVKKVTIDSDTEPELYDTPGAIQDDSTENINNDEGESSNLGGASGDAEDCEDMVDDDVDDLEESGELGIKLEEMDVDVS